MEKLLSLLAVVGAGAYAYFLLQGSRAKAAGVDAEPAQPFVPPADPLVSSPDRPRGIRNNNPGNLKLNNAFTWRGQIGSDGTYLIFDTALNGLRALMIDLHTDITRDGQNTVRALIKEFAPAQDSNPELTYVYFVSERIGVSPDQPLTWSQYIVPMAKAIVTFENGYNPYPDSLYLQAKQETGRT